MFLDTIYFSYANIFIFLSLYCRGKTASHSVPATYLTIRKSCVQILRDKFHPARKGKYASQFPACAITINKQIFATHRTKNIHRAMGSRNARKIARNGGYVCVCVCVCVHTRGVEIGALFKVFNHFRREKEGLPAGKLIGVTG